MYQPNKMSHRHDAIMDWMIANPDKTLGECAVEMGYTQPWLSVIVNSDMFQARYRERRDELEGVIHFDVKARLMAATSIALDKTMERLHVGPSEQFLQNTTKNLVTTVFGVREESRSQNHLHVHVDGEALLRARERAAAHFNGKSLSPAPNPSGEEVQEVEFVESTPA